MSLPTMKPSRVLNKLRAGEVACCFKINLADARAVEIAARAGFDCLWLDMEHVANDLSAIEACIWAAKSQDADTVVRVPRGSYSDYIRPLEMDASGIMVPHVMSLKDAEDVVRMTRFHPLGRRPVDGGNADAGYCDIALPDYIEQANRERFVILQIEDPETMDELEAIAQLPGYDMLFFGPGDFSHALGAPGQMDHPELRNARERIAATARKHGKFAGTVGAPAQKQSLIDMGYTFISMGADVAGLSQYCQGIMAEFDANPASNNDSAYET